MDATTSTHPDFFLSDKKGFMLTRVEQVQKDCLMMRPIWADMRDPDNVKLHQFGTPFFLN